MLTANSAKPWGVIAQSGVLSTEFLANTFCCSNSCLVYFVINPSVFLGAIWPSKLNFAIKKILILVVPIISQTEFSKSFNTDDCGFYHLCHKDNTSQVYFHVEVE